MKMLTNNLPRGTGYSPAARVGGRGEACPGTDAGSSRSRRRALAGELSTAIDGVSGFQTEFPKSRFQPAAAFLQFEALNAAGRPGEALTVIISFQGIEVPVAAGGR